jgi:hypothetical protein
MSFASVLDKLTGLLSKTFVLAAFMPVVLGAFLNSIVLFIDQPWIRKWLLGKPDGLQLMVVTVALCVAAYTLSSVSVYLQETLEGKHLLPQGIKRRMRATQQSKRQTVQSRYYEARDNALAIEAKREDWLDGMQKAFEGTQPTKARSGRNPTLIQVDLDVDILDTKRQQAAPATADRLDTVVNDLIEVLAQPGVDAARLDAAYEKLLSLIGYSEKGWRLIEAEFADDVELLFAAESDAPTRMGNVANSIEAYAWKRYGIKLRMFWSRLQVIVQVDKNYYSVLQDAKTQLDFLVACCWLSGLSWLGWMIVLPLTSYHLTLFLVVACVGPALCVFFYGLAVTNYAALGNLIECGVDLHRFELLTALHVKSPSSIREERAIWSALQSPREADLSYAPSGKTG